MEDQGRRALIGGIRPVSGDLVGPDRTDDRIAVLWPVRAAPLDRLPGSSADDPFLRLAAAWLIGHSTHTAIAYRRDLQAWATWCARLGTEAASRQIGRPIAHPGRED